MFINKETLVRPNVPPNKMEISKKQFSLELRSLHERQKKYKFEIEVNLPDMIACCLFWGDKELDLWLEPRAHVHWLHYTFSFF